VIAASTAGPTWSSSRATRAGGLRPAVTRNAARIAWVPTPITMMISRSVMTASEQGAGRNAGAGPDQHSDSERQPRRGHRDGGAGHGRGVGALVVSIGSSRSRKVSGTASSRGSDAGSTPASSTPPAVIHLPGDPERDRRPGSR
jgi:hypothetical protein